MKKTLMIAAAAAFVVSGMAAPAMAGNVLGKCKACHKADSDGTGPSWQSVAAAYGSADALAANMKAGLTERKAAVGKYAGKEGVMTPNVKKFAGAEDETAAAIFAEAGH